MKDLGGFYLRQGELRKVAQGDTVKTERVHLFILFYGSKMKQIYKLTDFILFIMHHIIM